MDRKSDLIAVGVGIAATVGAWYLWSYFRKVDPPPNPRHHTPPRRQTSNRRTSSTGAAESTKTKKVTKPEEQFEIPMNPDGANVRTINATYTHENLSNEAGSAHNQHEDTGNRNGNLTDTENRKAHLDEITSLKDANVSSLTKVEKISAGVRKGTSSLDDQVPERVTVVKKDQDTGNATKVILDKMFNVGVRPTTYNITTATESVAIAFGKEGCVFFSPYVRLLIPNDAVENQMEITITPHYEYQIDVNGRMLITPVIEFQSSNEIKFLKNIQVLLYTPYAAAEYGETVTVEIMRMRHGDNMYHVINKAELDQDWWVPFWTNQMCNLCAVLPLVDRARTKKRYFCAAIAPDTTQQHYRRISWMVCEDMPNNREINKEFFEVHDSRRLINAQRLEVSHDYNLRLQLQSQGKRLRPQEVDNNPDFQIEIENNMAEVPLHQRYNLGYDEKFEMCISTNEDNKFMLKLKYQVCATGYDSNLQNRVIFDKVCFLDWSTKPEPGTVINAIGDGSVGISNTVTQPQQTSRRDTSGYETDVRNVTPNDAAQPQDEASGQSVPAYSITNLVPFGRQPQSAMPERSVSSISNLVPVERRSQSATLGHNVPSCEDGARSLAPVERQPQGAALEHSIPSHKENARGLAPVNVAQSQIPVFGRNTSRHRTSRRNVAPVEASPRRSEMFGQSPPGYETRIKKVSPTISARSQIPTIGQRTDERNLNPGEIAQSQDASFLQSTSGFQANRRNVAPANPMPSAAINPQLPDANTLDILNRMLDLERLQQLTLRRLNTLTPVGHAMDTTYSSEADSTEIYRPGTQDYNRPINHSNSHPSSDWNEASNGNTVSAHAKDSSEDLRDQDSSDEDENAADITRRKLS